jgi:hypothetical protein
VSVDFCRQIESTEGEETEAVGSWNTVTHPTTVTILLCEREAGGLEGEIEVRRRTPEGEDLI